MRETRHRRVTLDEQLRYEIVVAGRMDPHILNWGASVQIVPSGEAMCEATLITGVFDQAALHGLLRSTYARGYPLVSVSLVEGPEEDPGQSEE